MNDTDMTYSVLTIAEITAGWGKHYNTIMGAYWKGKLVGRRTGKAGKQKMIIIDYASVVALWGKPKFSPFAE